MKKGERPLNVLTAMASAESNHVDHVVELMERDPSASSGDAEEQTTPLLIQAEVPKINIFTASYPRRKPRVIFICIAEMMFSLEGCFVHLPLF